MLPSTIQSKCSQALWILILAWVQALVCAAQLPAPKLAVNGGNGIVVLTVTPATGTLPTVQGLAVAITGNTMQALVLPAITLGSRISSGGITATIRSVGPSDITVAIGGLINNSSYRFAVALTDTAGGAGLVSAISEPVRPDLLGFETVFGSVPSANAVSGYPQIMSLVTDSSGSMFVTGDFDGATLKLGTFTLQRIGKRDAFVAKLGRDGTPLWAKNFGGGGTPNSGSATTTYGRALALSPDGSIVVTGNFSGGDLTTPAVKRASAYRFNAFLLKLSALGEVSWAQSIDDTVSINTDTNHSYLPIRFTTGVAVSGNGRIFLSGYFANGYIDFPPNTLSDVRNAFVVAYTADGQTLWSTSLGEGGATKVEAICTDKEGNLLLAGEFNGNALSRFGLKNIGAQDGFVARLSNNGDLLMAKNFGGQQASVSLKAIALDGSGNILVAGSHRGGDLTVPTLRASRDYYYQNAALAIKLDANGKVQWANTFGGENYIDESASAIVADTAGNVWIAGTFGRITQPAINNWSNYDGLVIKLDAASGTDVAVQNFGGFGAYVYLNAITIDNADNVVFGGSFQGPNLNGPRILDISTIETIFGQQRALLVKQVVFTSAKGAPTIGTATPGDQQASVSFLPPTDDGGYPITSYTVLSKPDSITSAPCPQSPCTITGLSNGKAYRFIVFANNAAGVSLPSAASNELIPAAPPSAPRLLVASGNSSATLSFALPANNGADISGFRISVTGSVSKVVNLSYKGYASSSVSEGGLTANMNRCNSTCEIVISGLSNGESYRFTVAAINRVGTGGASVPSTPITPSADYFALGLGWKNNDYYSSAKTQVFVRAVASDDAGNHYAAGDFAGPTLVVAGTSVQSLGERDAFVAKFNHLGALLWVRSVGGKIGGTYPVQVINARAFGYALAVDKVGNVTLAGTFDGTNLTIPPVRLKGLQDVFVVKFNPLGEMVWARDYGAIGGKTSVAAMVVDGQGDLMLAGSMDVPALGVPNLARIGNTDAYAVRLNGSDGLPVWAANFGGFGAEAYGRSIAIDSHGDVIVAGSFQFNNLSQPALTKQGSRDAFAIKLSPGGQTLWARTIGAAGADVFLEAVITDSTGNIYLGGSYFGGSAPLAGLTKLGNRDGLVLRMNRDGSLAWARNFGGAGAFVFGQVLALGNRGNVLLAGSYSGDLSNPRINGIGPRDALLIEMDRASGVVGWVANVGGSSAYTYGQALSLDGAGNVLLGGYFDGSSLNSPTLVLQGASDGLLLKQLMPLDLPPPVQASADCVFSWAEQQYPTFLAPTPAQSLTTASYFYRYYSDSKAYLGVERDTQHLLYLAAPYSGGPVDLGDIQSWIGKANCKPAS